MKHPAQIILAPVITEKTTGLKDATRTLCFKVDTRANKIEIKGAVESLFKVKVSTVRTLNVRGKWKRMGRTMGKRPNWKKAYVTLAEGQKMIEYFEGT